MRPATWGRSKGGLTSVCRWREWWPLQTADHSVLSLMIMKRKTRLPLTLASVVLLVGGFGCEKAPSTNPNANAGGSTASKDAGAAAQTPPPAPAPDAGSASNAKKE